MAFVTIDEIKDQMEVLGVKYVKLDVQGPYVMMTVQQRCQFPMVEFKTIDDLRTEIVDTLAHLHQIQQEEYSRFQVASRQRHEDFERRLREEG